MTKAFLRGGVALTLAGTAAIAVAQTPPIPPSMASASMARVATRGDVATRVRTSFARLDANRDGALTQDEVRPGAGAMRGGRGGRGMGSMPGMRGMPGNSDMRGMRGEGDPAQRAAGLAATFDRIDRDRNGVITRDEFTAAPMTQVIQINRRQVRSGGMGMGMGGNRGMGANGGMGERLFGIADANRDGRVTLTEATDTALRRFDRMDRNRDGRITPDERPARGQWNRRG